MRIDLPLIPVDEPEPCAARVPLFTGLDLEQLRRVSALARPIVLEAGDALHLAGDRTDRLCVVHTGRLALTLGSATGRERVVRMVEQHDAEGFGGCTNTGACTVSCPKEIPLDVISQLNKDLRTAIKHGH